MASSTSLTAKRHHDPSGGLRNPRRPRRIPPQHHRKRDAEFALVSTETNQCLIPSETSRREQRISERLQDEKFILKPELYQWLVELEKENGKNVDRKDVDRILKKLQEQGQCKCIQINVPAVTYCGRSRIIQVVLHSSSEALNAELLGQIHDKLRSFEIQIHGHGSSKGKNNDSCPGLEGEQRIENHPSSEVQVARSEAMSANKIHLRGQYEGCLAEPENEPRNLEEDGESYSLIRKCALDKMKQERTKRFSWTDETDRQLVIQYARHRAALGARCHRVDWTLVPGLPAPPTNCGRRMSSLKRNTKFRKALMKLCNILGERYVKHLKENGNRLIDIDGSEQLARCPSKEGRVSNFSNGIEPSRDVGFGLERWDDFDDEHVKSALEDVFQFKHMAKLEACKRVGSIAEEWSNMNTASESPSAGRRKDYKRTSQCHQFHQKLIKLWNGETNVGREIYESLAVSNAVELLKLVFLSTTKSPRLPNLLEETLRRYSERDLFTAFSYLRDRKFTIGGSGGQPFQLSAHFLHSISRSPFQLNTGKRASTLSAWLLEREKDIMEEGINLFVDLHCGDIFQLFSLVLSGELSLSPCLPDEGVGEAGDLQGLKRKAEDNESQGGQQVNKMKSLTEGELVSRREKGFPGIAVSVYRKKFLTANTLELFKDRRTWMHRLSLDEESQDNDYNPTKFNCLKEMIDMGSVSSIALNASESPWDAMTKFAEHLMSMRLDEGQGNHFDPAVFKAVSAAIQRAGDQGLSIGDLSSLIDMRGENLLDLVIDVLQTFGRVVKVNAFDSVHVVDALYRSKYFLNSVGFQQDPKPSSSTQSQERRNNGDIQPKKHCNDVASIHPGIGKNANDVHKVTILNLPEKLVLHSTESAFGSVCKGSVQGKSGFSDGSNEAEINEDSSNELSVPILPWVDGDGAVNTVVYNGLVRRVLGIVMQNPGIVEDDIIRWMDVLNPQSCKKLLERIILEGHLSVRKVLQTANSGPPALLKTLLVGSSSRKSESVYRKHFFANPSSIQSL